MLFAEAKALRAAHAKASRKLAELTERNATLSAYLGAYGGADSAYYALIGKCVELSAPPYTYRACPFGAATQEPGATSLGVADGWVEGSDPSATPSPVMLFEGGAPCWNGPARSLRLTLACGGATSLRDVSEPNRCEYIGTLETPAACDPAAAAELRQQARDAAAAAEAAVAAAAAARGTVHTEL